MQKSARPNYSEEEILDFFINDPKPQLNEIGKVLITLSDPSKFSILDAMTPLNMNWILESVKKSVLASGIIQEIGWDSGNYYLWALCMEFSFYCFSGEHELTTALTDRLYIEKTEHANRANEVAFSYCLLSNLFDVTDEVIFKLAQQHYEGQIDECEPIHRVA